MAVSHRMRFVFIFLLACFAMAAFSMTYAQESHPASAAPATDAPQPAAATQGVPAKEPEARGADRYRYDAAGRRDPFVSLVHRGTDVKASVKRRDGLAGLSIAEVMVRGIVRTQGTFVAMLEGPDKKTHVVHPDDRLLDGTVKSITGDAVVFLQDFVDQLSIARQREVRKPLRSMEDTQ